MFGTGIKTILASGFVAATMFAFSAPIANAGSLEITIGADGYSSFRVEEAGYRHGEKRGYDRGHGRNNHGYRGHRGRDGRGYGRHHNRRQGCSPRRAVNKAWNMGLNRPHIHRVGGKHIVVKGRYRGSRSKIVFARYGGCQVVDFVRRGR